MRYRMIALDFDGTLRARHNETVSPAVADALRTVQKNGVKVVVATGRSRGGLPQRLLDGLAPDYYILANGAEILDGGRNELFADRLTAPEMDALVEWCESGGYPLAFTFSDAYYCYVKSEEFNACYGRMTGGGNSICRNGQDRTRHLTEMPVGAFLFMPGDQTGAFREKYAGLGLDFYCYSGDPCSADVIRCGVSKANALQRLAGMLGIDRAQIVAVGDGSNDLPMLEYAGLGVAMASASLALRSQADRVCGADFEDGVATLCYQLFPTAFVRPATTADQNEKE